MTHVMIVGGGGREHALAWKIRQSPQCGQLYVAPGNAGTATVAENLPLAVDDFESLATACREKQVSLLVVGPEVPLVKGIRNYFATHCPTVAVVGPDRLAARLEGSKDFAKAFMQRHGIPTAPSLTFTADTLAEGTAYLGTLPPPYVLKADGLAAGKGVIITESLDEARDTLRQMLQDLTFGAASERVVVEQFLRGTELSVFALCDGTDYQLLPSAKDYKRIGEGDTGPNTGGMGAVSPWPAADDAFLSRVRDRIIEPTLAGMKAEGNPFRGFLFVGLMNVDGAPFVIEYNVRLGDPETQVVLPRLQSDLLPLLLAATDGTLREHPARVDSRAATTVVLAALGYPGAYEKGLPVGGLDRLSAGTLAFHAGTQSADGQTVTSGGRVLALTALHEDLAAAVKAAQTAAATVEWPGRYYRRDIGQDALRARS